MSIQIALCGLPPPQAREIAASFEQQPGLGLTVSSASSSTDELLTQLATRPAHGVILDAGLGPEALSLAQELRAAGYEAVCLVGDPGLPQLQRRAVELGIALLPDYRPARIASQIRQLLGLTEGDAADGRVIAFFSPRGGAGTTTLLLALAQLLTARGRTVAIVEVGGGGSCIPLLGLRPAGGWAELLPMAMEPTAAPEAATLLSRALVEVRPGLHLLPSGGPAIMDQLTADGVEQVLSLLSACGIDLTLVDTGPELTLPTATALCAADRLCLVALPDLVSAFRLAQVQELLAALCIPAERIYPVINRAREPLPPRLDEVLRFLGYRPALRIPEESKPPLDPAGQFVGFRRGSGAEKAVQSLLESLTLEVSLP